MAGRGAVTITRRSDRSVVTRLYATSPLRLLTPANHGRAAWIFSSSLGGGFVNGDCNILDLLVETGAAAFLSTQAASKVYRSPLGTSADLHAHVSDAGLLLVLPDPVVCFAGSRYRQGQQFDLAATAGLVLLDWLTSGRRAAGERWDFEEYSSRTVIRVGGRLILHDALALRHLDGSLADRFGRFDVLATVALVGASLRGFAEGILSTVAGRPVERQPEMVIGASRTRDGGCVLRIAGRSVEDVGGSVREFLSFVPALLGDDPWARKW
jgi:urease accessory protein